MRVKVFLPSEMAYLVAICILPLAVSILAEADFGLSMIVSPAYLVSLRLGNVTFGQAEYLTQAVVFALLCIVLGRFRPIFCMSFVTCLIYGRILDLWRMLPCFNPKVTVPGCMGFPLRVVLFCVGVLLTSFSLALFFKTYLFPQVYDFFVKAVSLSYGVPLPRFKTAFDLVLLTLSVLLSFCFFGHLAGVGVGTLILALCNGTLIGFFGRVLDILFVFRPLFPRYAEGFDLASCLKNPIDTNTVQSRL